jgi:hypothetical protein
LLVLSQYGKSPDEENLEGRNSIFFTFHFPINVANPINLINFRNPFSGYRKFMDGSLHWNRVPKRKYILPRVKKNKEQQKLKDIIFVLFWVHLDKSVIVRPEKIEVKEELGLRQISIRNHAKMSGIEFISITILSIMLALLLFLTYYRKKVKIKINTSRTTISIDKDEFFCSFYDTSEIEVSFSFLITRAFFLFSVW